MLCYSHLVIVFVVTLFVVKLDSTAKGDTIEHVHNEFDSGTEYRIEAHTDTHEVTAHIAHTDTHEVTAMHQNRSKINLPNLYRSHRSSTGTQGNDVIRKTLRTSLQQDIQGKRSERSAANPNEGLTKDEICLLQVHQNTTETFYSRVMYDKVDALSLNFKFSEDITVSAVPGLILSLQWRWVYQETLSYLRMPYAAVVWSLGLLYMHNGKPLDVYLYYPYNTPESCYSLSIGEETSDMIIGKALGQMTKVIAQKNHRYNSSHWCYMRKIEENNAGVISVLDNNFFSTSPSLENSCCKYSSDEHGQSVECSNIFNYDAVWWDAPLGIGIILLLYFPLLFLKVIGMLCTKAVTSQLKGHTDRNDTQTNSTIPSEHESSSHVKLDSDSGFIYLENSSPITVQSIVTSSCASVASLSLSTKSRISIFIWTLFTVLVPGLELLSYYVFLYDYTVDLANNDVSTGWSSMIVGWKSNRMKFNLFEGPFVTLGMYLIIGWLILLVPTSLSDQIANGIDYRYKYSSILLNIPLEKKEILGSVDIKKCLDGFSRLFRLQVCHIFMILNTDFWVFMVKEIKSKFLSLYKSIQQLKCNLIVRYLFILVCVPIFFIFSVIEVVYLIIIYTIPLLSFTCYTLTGLCIGLNNYLSGKVFCNHGRFGPLISLIACGLLALCFICHVYIFTILFVDGFFFFSRIIMFTFTAFVAYPRETYGYLMLVVLSAYFILEGMFRFGIIYRQILKYAVKFSKQDLSKEEYKYHFRENINANGALVYGISNRLFEYLVDHIRPRRVQVLYTCIKLAFTIFVLTVSITLIDHFKRFEELSLFVHIFITLCICFLPRLYDNLIATRGSKQKLKSKVRNLLRMWKSQPTATV